MTEGVEDRDDGTLVLWTEQDRHGVKFQPEGDGLFVITTFEPSHPFNVLPHYLTPAQRAALAEWLARHTTQEAP